jgi:hypothetical protein
MGLILLITIFVLPFYLCYIILKSISSPRVHTKIIPGKNGEVLTANYLSKLNQEEYLVINDITLKKGMWTGQIDHLVISRFGIFVVETKDWKGRLYGYTNNKYLTLCCGRKSFTVYNPLVQNMNHISLLEKILYGYYNLNIVSIVAFTPRISFRTGSGSFLFISEIIDYIKKYNEPIMSINKRDSIYRLLLKLKEEGKSLESEHIQFVQSMALDKELENCRVRLSSQYRY